MQAVADVLGVDVDGLGRAGGQAASHRRAATLPPVPTQHASGCSRRGLQRPVEERDFAPIAVVEVELSAPIEPIPATDPLGRRYGAARVFVRLHSRPVGLLELPVGDRGVTSATVAGAIWDELAAAVNGHLRGDALPEVGGIEAGGLPPVTSPPCVHRREALLLDPPSASVVVCTRNRAGELAGALRSIEALEYPDVELVVVDGSADSDTADLVREEFPRASYLNVGANGIAVARNRGCAAASGEIVAYTDDDATVDRHWLAELACGLASGERVACATGMVLPLELATPAQLWFEESGAFTQGFERRTIGLDLPRAPGSLLPYATGRIGAGVSMAWRRSVLRDLGGFDPALDTLIPPWPPRSRNASAGEDLAAFFDALVHGHRIVFEPNAVTYHEHRRTYDELARQLYWHGIGLSAYLTRCIAVHPRQLPGFVRRIPRGVYYGFARASPRNDKKSSGFPTGLTRAEQLGVAHGPFAYIRGLRMARGIREAERRVASGAT